MIVVDRLQKIFVGKRIDNQSDSWQMPQGGIDAGENEDVAMFRELKEETGISDQFVKIIKKSDNYFYYDLPYKLQKKFWGGKYLGQRQRWYLLEFVGDDADVNIASQEPEFSEWKWIEKVELINLIVNFKRELYQKIVNEFADYL